METPVENSSKLDSYGRLKLKLEELIKQATEMGKIRGSNPRLFSLAGPGLHLNSGYALPTFIDSARKGFPIIIEGNPNTQRTYLYPTDLVERLVLIGTSPDIRDFQIGARRNLRMIEIANKVGEIWGVPVKLENTLNLQANYYCPDENNGESELDFEEILIRWKRWLESSNQSN
jgi:nucleoside-diphosphate-sugar epimerase